MLKIIIPTDFSETAMNAIRYALELFKYEKCEFLIMNAFADDVYNNTAEMDREYFEEYKENCEKATQRELQKVIVEMLSISSNPKHKYNYVALFGSLVDEVNSLVDTHNADVVVMGTKGKSNIKDITFGSQTLQVIKYIQSPVIAVPVCFHGYPLKKIVFATDYILPLKDRELKLVNKLASRFAAMVDFLHISEVKELSHRQQDNRAYLNNFYEDTSVSHIKSVGTDITQAINKTLEDPAIDMLVMVNQRHSYLENILYRSTIEKVGLEIKIPLLILQNLPRS